MIKSNFFPNLVIHGGVENGHLPEKIEKEYHQVLHQVLTIGYESLLMNRSSLSVVEQVVELLENQPLFNAGYGSVLNQEGAIELDAAIMDGQTLNAGCVAGVCRVANPITLARIVLEHSKHIMLSGYSAEEFGKQNGLSLIDPNNLITQKQQKKWEISCNTGKKSAQQKYGTVGAVALDKFGNVSAATSTGGLANKYPGRIGDSCIIGAGTYANNATCAVSTTGQGEYFMRLLTAYDVSALMSYQHYSLKKSVENALQKLTTLGGQGGLIAINNKGEIAISFNTKGMYRGYIDNEKPVIKIY